MIEDDPDARIESSAQRWEAQRLEQQYREYSAFEGYDPYNPPCSPTCNCPKCCGSEPPDSPDDPVCDCGFRMRDLVSFWREDLEGHVVDCKQCRGKKTFHQAAEDGVCISCGHTTGIDAEGSVYINGKVTYDAEQAWYQG